MLLLLQPSCSVNGEAGTVVIPLFQHGWLIGALATSNGVIGFLLMGKRLTARRSTLARHICESAYLHLSKLASHGQSEKNVDFS